MKLKILVTFIILIGLHAASGLTDHKIEGRIGLENDLLLNKSIKPFFLKNSLLTPQGETLNDSLTKQTLFTTVTTSNTTTLTLVETTSPPFGSPMVIFDAELSLEENDTVRIETSGGAKVTINPTLEEVMREGYTRLYRVLESGVYKIRVTTGHGAERLFVNIYRIISYTYSQTFTYTTTLILTSSMQNTTSKSLTTVETKTETSVNSTIRNESTPLAQEPVPGFKNEVILLGIVLGSAIILISRGKMAK